MTREQFLAALYTDDAFRERFFCDSRMTALAAGLSDDDAHELARMDMEALRLAAPDLLEHLGRQGIAEREGSFLYRFDPQCNGARNPVDGWSLLPQIKAPTLLVRGELSPIMPKEMADRMEAAIPNARLVTMLGVYHHLVLDAPEAFSRILDDFLRDLPG